jgi:hypothetical protein
MAKASGLETAAMEEASPFGMDLIAGLLCIVTVILTTSRLFRKKSPYPLPPGPPGEPILGHLRVVPTERPELYYEQLAKEYSEYITSCEELAIC